MRGFHLRVTVGLLLAVLCGVSATARAECSGAPNAPVVVAEGFSPEPIVAEGYAPPPCQGRRCSWSRGPVRRAVGYVFHRRR